MLKVGFKGVLSQCQWYKMDRGDIKRLGVRDTDSNRIEVSPNYQRVTRVSGGVVRPKDVHGKSVGQYGNIQS